MSGTAGQSAAESVSVPVVPLIRLGGAIVLPLPLHAKQQGNGAARRAASFPCGCIVPALIHRHHFKGGAVNLPCDRVHFHCYPVLIQHGHFAARDLDQRSGLGQPDQSAAIIAAYGHGADHFAILRQEPRELPPVSI